MNILITDTMGGNFVIKKKNHRKIHNQMFVSRRSNIQMKTITFALM